MKRADVISAAWRHLPARLRTETGETTPELGFSDFENYNGCVYENAFEGQLLVTNGHFSMTNQTAQNRDELSTTENT